MTWWYYIVSWSIDYSHVAPRLGLLSLHRFCPFYEDETLFIFTRIRHHLACSSLVAYNFEHHVDDVGFFVIGHG